MPSTRSRMFEWGRRLFPSPRAPRLPNPPATPKNAWRSPGGRPYSPDVESPTVTFIASITPEEWSREVLDEVDERLTSRTVAANTPTPSLTPNAVASSPAGAEDEDMQSEQPHEAAGSHGEETAGVGEATMTELLDEALFGPNGIFAPRNAVPSPAPVSSSPAEGDEEEEYYINQNDVYAQEAQGAVGECALSTQLTSYVDNAHWLDNALFGPGGIFSPRKRKLEEALATPLSAGEREVPDAPRKRHKGPRAPMGEQEKEGLRAARQRAQFANERYQAAKRYHEGRRLRARAAAREAVRGVERKHGNVLRKDLESVPSAPKKRRREPEDGEDEQRALASAKRPKLPPSGPATRLPSSAASLGPDQEDPMDREVTIRERAAVTLDAFAQRAKNHVAAKAKRVSARAKDSARTAKRLIMGATEQDRAERDLQVEVWKDNFRSWKGYLGL
jgi:hypothetical protein